MASIRTEVSLSASAQQVWEVLADVGNLPKLVPGFVTRSVLEADGRAREVTFANGLTVREVIVTVDHDAKRVVWSAAGGALTHHNASAQVLDSGAGCTFVWLADLLPDEAASGVAAMIQHGLAAVQRAFPNQR